MNYILEIQKIHEVTGETQCKELAGRPDMKEKRVLKKGFPVGRNLVGHYQPCGHIARSALNKASQYYDGFPLEQKDRKGNDR